MKQLIDESNNYLGKDYPIIQQKDDKDTVQFREDQVSIIFNRRTAELLLKAFLVDLIFNKLVEIYEQIKREVKIDLLRSLDFIQRELVIRKVELPSLKVAE